jgi:Uncharacterized protein conserved in bacteria
MTSAPGTRRWRTFYRLTRDVHLYAGLFVSPFVLVYAVSAMFLNHAFLPWGGRLQPAALTRTIAVVVHDSGNSLDVAREVRRQIGVSGEIGYVNLQPPRHRLTFPIESPGRITNVRVDLASGMATIEQRESGVWDGMIQLHKMPGPHNANIRGNWVFTRLWGWLADATVYLLMFLSVSGVYLWAVLKADRRTGLLFLGGGVLSFAAIVFAIVA